MSYSIIAVLFSEVQFPQLLSVLYVSIATVLEEVFSCHKDCVYIMYVVFRLKNVIFEGIKSQKEDIDF